MIWYNFLQLFYNIIIFSNHRVNFDDNYYHIWEALIKHILPFYIGLILLFDYNRSIRLIFGYLIFFS